MTLTKYEPLNATRLFDPFFRWFEAGQRWGDGGEFLPATDVEERDKDYLVKMELPGVTKKDVTVSVEDGHLAIEGEKKAEERKEEDGYCRRESYYGKFRRTFHLGEGIDPKAIKAEYKDGVLRLTVPKVEKAIPHKVEVA